MDVLNETIESLEQKTKRILQKAFWLAYEDNPARTEWPLHDINTDAVIDIKGKSDVYYMADLYLTDTQLNNLWNVVEGLPMWIDVYKSGRCSIHDLLNTYTIENLELHLNKAELILRITEDKRTKFLAKNNPQ